MRKAGEVGQGENGIRLLDRKYFRLRKAAEILNCDADELLHLGVTGDLEIMSPVVHGGEFEFRDLYSDEVQVPFVHDFGPGDRVVLTAYDLAHIEGVGWTIPNCFYNPLEVEQLIMNWRAGDRSVITNDDHLSVVGAMATQLWVAINTPGIGVEKTTIEHLFISHEELDRIQKGGPLSEMAIERKRQGNSLGVPRIRHGNEEHNASTREEVLKFAIYCKAKWPEECKNPGGKETNRAWAEIIDEKSGLAWPADNAPPLSRDTIERLLGEALKFGEKNSPR